MKSFLREKTSFYHFSVLNDDAGGENVTAVVIGLCVGDSLGQGDQKDCGELCKALKSMKSSLHKQHNNVKMFTTTAGYCLHI